MARIHLYQGNYQGNYQGLLLGKVYNSLPPTYLLPIPCFGYCGPPFRKFLRPGQQQSIRSNPPQKIKVIGTFKPQPLLAILAAISDMLGIGIS